MRSKYDYIWIIDDQEVSAGEHGRIQETFGMRFERDYCKVSKVIHHMLGGRRMADVVSLTIAGVRHKLLFIGYGAGHVILLRTKSHNLPTFYTKETFGKVKQILTDM